MLARPSTRFLLGGEPGLKYLPFFVVQVAWLRFAVYTHISVLGTLHARIFLKHPL